MAQVVSIKVHDCGNLEVNKTFRIRKNVLLEEFAPNSPIRIALDATFSDSIKLNDSSFTLQDYEDFLSIIRKKDQRERTTKLIKYMKGKDTKQLMGVGKKMARLGAHNICFKLQKYLAYWKDSNFSIREDEAMFTFNAQDKKIMFCKRNIYSFKKTPEDEFKDLWIESIRLITPKDAIISHKDKESKINFLEIKGDIDIGGFDLKTYEKMMDFYEENKEEGIAKFYSISDSLAVGLKIGGFYEKVTSRIKKSLTISESTFQTMKKQKEINNLKSDNVIGVFSLLRDFICLCDSQVIKDIEQIIWEELKLKFMESSIFDTLFTLLLLDTTGLLSVRSVEYGISVIGIFTIFFKDRFNIESINPDYVYNFLLSLIPKRLFKYPAHIYFSLPQHQRLYPEANVKQPKGEQEIPIDSY
jgi:hypothetical protein